MEMENISIKPVWAKSKEETWDKLFAGLDDSVEKKALIRRMPVWTYAAAIIFVILLTGSFYTVAEQTMKGEHRVVLLPDRSTVTLNAESRLSYKPCVWFISRKVHLAGEACFEVETGSRFSVQSGRNQVNVLGTTFNIYTRPGMYRVTCLTGKVEVQSDGETVVLNPNMQATVHEQILSVNSHIAHSAATGWMQGKFDFVNTPLSEVIAEIERQYNVEIMPDYNPNLLYSGNFSKSANPGETLQIIGKPFGITLRIK